MKQILSKLINVNQNDWDVMLPMALQVYRTIYKVSTQHIPCKLVYGLLPTKFIVPTNIIIIEKDNNWMNALLVQMEILVLLDEKKIIAKNFLYYTQKFKKTSK